MNPYSCVGPEECGSSRTSSPVPLLAPSPSSSSSPPVGFLFGDQKCIFGLHTSFYNKGFMLFLILAFNFLNYITNLIIYTLASNYITHVFDVPLWTNYGFALIICTTSEFLSFYIFAFNLRKFNLCLQNTLNMLKTTRVSFGVLQMPFLVSL